MSWRDERLYLEAHDLAIWMRHRADAWVSRDDRGLAQEVDDDAIDLVAAVALAVAFPERKSEPLNTAEAIVARLHNRLGTAHGRKRLGDDQLRFVNERLHAIHQMIESWRIANRPRNTAFPRA